MWKGEERERENSGKLYGIQSSLGVISTRTNAAMFLLLVELVLYWSILVAI
jgi:hypothetical protein